MTFNTDVFPKLHFWGFKFHESSPKTNKNRNRMKDERRRNIVMMSK